jgi:oligopeptide/dipeptide ABC transporter ATP-binding protein
MAGGLLDVRDLNVGLRKDGGVASLVADLSFSVARGEVLCIVGESGCGKTITARSIIGLNRDDPRFRLSGTISFENRDLLGLDERAMRAIRGSRIAMIFQDPMSSLNPLQRIGAQIEEALALHTDLGRRARRLRSIALLEAAGIPRAETRVDDYPHQFSGGMRQRAMIALALAAGPDLLIADEPTTALDVTMQRQILELLARLRAETGMAVIFITHDLGVVAEIADRVLVMYAGQCVEAGPVEDVLHRPQHPYTAALIASIPSVERSPVDRLPAISGAPPMISEGRPAGCAFRPRCGHAFARCQDAPALAPAGPPRHFVRCWLPRPHREQLAGGGGLQ